MLNEAHLCQVLQAEEIDTSFIDHSLSYAENKANLYKQFGVKFSQTNYNQKYRRAEEMISRDTMLANMRSPAKPCQVESLPAPRLPFDPIERARQVENVVMKGDSRMYYRFRHADFYGPGGIVTGDMIGCNFLCAYCWGYSRNEKPNTGDAYYSPSQVVARLESIANKKGCNQYRLSGAEPFLGLQSARHIAKVIKATDGYFVIETNGYQIGLNPEILDLFKDLDVFWRVTIKGHNAETFEKVTGCQGKDYFLPLMAIDFIKQQGFNYQVAFNPKIVNEKALKLPVGSDIEHERMRSYAGVTERMKARGIGISQPARVRSPAKACQGWKPARKEGDEWRDV